MIFATLGTHEQHFTRAAHLIAALTVRDEVILQSGGTLIDARPNLRVIEFMEFDDVESHMRGATCVISHAGVGSILTAVACGHRPIVIPRLAELGEHVDDHQLELASVLDDRGILTCYHEGDDLAALAQGSVRLSGSAGIPASELGAAIREEVRLATGL